MAVAATLVMRSASITMAAFPSSAPFCSVSGVANTRTSIGSSPFASLVAVSYSQRHSQALASPPASQASSAAGMACRARRTPAAAR